MISGSFLALSMVLLLGTLAVQAWASHDRFQENTFQPRIPPVGSVYVIDIDGTAKIKSKGVSKLASADIELKVVSVKAKGIPTIHLVLKTGELSLGDNVYVLEKGSAVIQKNKVILKVTSNDGKNILDVYATLAGSLPIKTTEKPVKIVPGQDRKSASIQIFTEKWTLDFGGNMDRTA